MCAPPGRQPSLQRTAPGGTRGIPDSGCSPTGCTWALRQHPCTMRPTTPTLAVLRRASLPDHQRAVLLRGPAAPLQRRPHAAQHLQGCAPALCRAERGGAGAPVPGLQGARQRCPPRSTNISKQGCTLGCRGWHASPSLLTLELARRAWRGDVPAATRAPHMTWSRADMPPPRHPKPAQASTGPSRLTRPRSCGI